MCYARMLHRSGSVGEHRSRRRARAESAGRPGGDRHRGLAHELARPADRGRRGPRRPSAPRTALRAIVLKGASREMGRRSRPSDRAESAQGPQEGPATFDQGRREGSASRSRLGPRRRIEATYTVPVQHHACLETHGVVVDWKRRAKEATIYCSDPRHVQLRRATRPTSSASRTTR